MMWAVQPSQGNLYAEKWLAASCPSVSCRDTLNPCRSLQDPGKAPKIEEATGAQPKLRKVALIVKLKKLMQEAEKESLKALPWARPPVRGPQAQHLHSWPSLAALLLFTWLLQSIARALCSIRASMAA